MVDESKDKVKGGKENFFSSSVLFHFPMFLSILSGKRHWTIIWRRVPTIATSSWGFFPFAPPRWVFLLFFLLFSLLVLSHYRLSTMFQNKTWLVVPWVLFFSVGPREGGPFPYCNFTPFSCCFTTRLFHSTILCRVPVSTLTFTMRGRYRNEKSNNFFFSSCNFLTSMSTTFSVCFGPNGWRMPNILPSWFWYIAP